MKKAQYKGTSRGANPQQAMRRCYFVAECMHGVRMGRCHMCKEFWGQIQFLIRYEQVNILVFVDSSWIDNWMNES